MVEVEVDVLRSRSPLLTPTVVPVRLVVDGIKYQLAQEGNQTTSPDPKGPPKLMINYIADRESPDIAKIEKGELD